MDKFAESCCCPEDDEFISSCPWVYADPDGYFVTVETDSYEGCAQMTLPAAKKVYAALARAIEFAETARAKKKTQATSVPVSA